MNIRQIAMRAALIILVGAPGFALAQGGGDHWRLHNTSPSSAERGSAMQLHGMMQQMGGMMEHMAARIQAGPLTSDQTKQMSAVMGHIAEMMNNLYGMKGEETPQQMLNMLERMTDMHKRLMVVLAGPEPGKK